MVEASAVLVYLGGKSERLDELAYELMLCLGKKELQLWYEVRKTYQDQEGEDGLKVANDYLRDVEEKWRALGNDGEIPEFRLYPAC